MIAELIKTFNNIGLKLTSEEIADILWLAEHLEKPETRPSQERQKSDSDSLPPARRTPDFPQKHDGRGESSDKEKEPETGIHPSGSGEKAVGTGTGGIPIRSPGGSALPGELSISRALRPLMRKVPSRSRFALDEDATVQRIADEDNWAPVYVPALSRWLDVVLVVDEWASMAVWQETVAELKQLLERQAAFRDVQVWGFRTENGNAPVLHVGTGFNASEHPARSPRELIDPCGQRLILLVSDCVSPAWYDGRIVRMTANWTDKNMVAVVQLLPDRLWRRTGIGKAVSAYLRGLTPGTVNAKLETKSTNRIFRREIPPGLKIPVITLEPHSLKPWAHSVAGMGGLWIPGVVFPTVTDSKKEKPPSEADSEQKKIPTPEERIQFFRATASPLAWKLAGYLSAAPLSLPVMRLVQKVMLRDESRQIHLAEVFLSGLMERVTPKDALLHPDNIQYDFVGDIREQLLSTIYISESIDVLEEVSKYIGEHIGKPRDFQAMLADPSIVDGMFVDEGSLPFANVALTVLEGLGGDYRRLAERLKQSLIRDENSDKGITATLEKTESPEVKVVSPIRDENSDKGVTATLEKTESPEVKVVSPETDSVSPEVQPKRFINSLGMEFVWIPPGEFMMGSPEDEPGRFDNEKLHRVKLNCGFYMQTTTVTQGQWKALMGNNPSYFKKSGDKCPVEQVSWNDAQGFIKKLNQKEKKEYRLPTEAEWEYACRAGTDTPFYFGGCLSTDEANYNGKYPLEGCPKGEYRKKTVPVGTFPPNAWGLYDMHGNVWEWCQDWYGDYPSDAVIDPAGTSSGLIRFLRGGSWYDYAHDCRSANRYGNSPDNRDNYLGFRLVLPVGQQG